MTPAPLPSNEVERLKALHDLQILDTPAEGEFDDITLLASQICSTPVSMISFVDEDRQWYKSKLGTELSGTPREVAFCGHTVAQAELLVVRDTHADERFADNPLVTGDAQVRFYAGAPLMTPEGLALGALCVVDHTPRELTEAQTDALRALARQVMSQLRLKRTVAQLAQSLISQHRAEKQLEHVAKHDGLTGLPNRTLFLDRLDQCLARMRRAPATRFAVLFLDLDRFKIVNDSLGHAAGDHLLQTVAERLMQCVRDTDTITQRAADAHPPASRASETTVARLGGDEFTILLGEIASPTDAARVAERILSRLTLPIAFGGQELMASASIGIVIGSSDYLNAADLLRDADVAMYRAKLEGRGQYMLFDTTMQTTALKRLRLESALRRAVERQELLLHYQPIIDFRTCLPTGVEALLRWRRDGTLVSPAEFIPLAEETGLIIPIGAWVLRESCNQLALWQRANPDLAQVWMSVNLSRRQIADPNLLNIVRRTLQETGVDATCIKLEITESLVIDDSNVAVRQTLTDLRALGLQLSLDDFGTGYSSLSCLHRFPIDVLKIDRAFVQHVSSEENTAAVVEAIIRLAHALHIAVVAGVETRTQCQWLRALGCDLGQGYLFSKPLPADAAEQFLLTGRARSPRRRCRPRSETAARGTSLPLKTESATKPLPVALVLGGHAWHT